VIVHCSLHGLPTSSERQCQACVLEKTSGVRVLPIRETKELECAHGQPVSLMCADCMHEREAPAQAMADTWLGKLDCPEREDEPSPDAAEAGAVPSGKKVFSCLQRNCREEALPESSWCSGHQPVELARSLADDIEHKALDVYRRAAHYNRGRIEVWDFIADQRLGFLAGNVCKYIARYKHKGQALSDLNKARAYLDKLIAKVEGGEDE
jgi:hypothetical protein